MKAHIALFENIRSSFGQLFSYKLRGNTIEIITPFSTTTNKFVSVFVSEQGKEFVITDGGWLSDGTYEVDISEQDSCFVKIRAYYMAQFKIRSKDVAEVTFFYKKTEDVKLVSSLIYDLSNFITGVANASQVQFIDPKEKEEQQRFSKSASNFIRSFVPKEKFLANKPVITSQKNVKFNAIIKQKADKVIVVMYITGSSVGYFRNSINNGEANFQIVSRNQDSKSFVSKKVAFINDIADGYKKEKLYDFLGLLESQATKTVTWSEKEKLTKILV